MTKVGQAIEAKRRQAADVLELLPARGDAIVGLGNGEPKTVLDAIEAGAERFEELRLHQMLPLRDRPYIEGELAGLRHVSWFLSPHDKAAFHRGDCDLVPNNFSEVPALMRRTLSAPVALAAASPPDAHGYFSLGTHAEYVAPMIGEIPFFLEVNARMPRTFGENQIHVSQIAGWCEADYPLVELPPRPAREADRRIAELVAERIPDGATIQAGIGAVPDQVLALLAGHRHLGVHTELLSEGFVDLIEAGAVTGTRKRTHRNKLITTSAVGTTRLYEFVADNPGVEFWPVDETNDPGNVSAEPHFTAINATIEVDFLGQCASESLGSDYWSSSGGQPDFARGAVLSEGGQAFIVLHSTTGDAETSRIVPRLHPGAAVTTFKNVVDKVVTEHGVAELRGSSIAERTRRLIAIADPRFRDELSAEAKACGYLT
ncbi:MAG TPA: acetyl-CoA hydrolase/transferase C-terminal domain-containing protein [Solirubrobacterales bacterium]|nr:acetyl-CoA hydrolase/transferase C-terminal domain-containing protein [Solirubrobacterales bacterium]